MAVPASLRGCSAKSANRMCSVSQNYTSRCPLQCSVILERLSDRGRPVAFSLTPGNVGDITMAVPLLNAVEQPKRLIADKAYDVDSLRNWLKARRIKAVIPSTATRTVPYPLDRVAYRRRNLIERLFGRLKNWRRIATRYDRLARNYIAALAIIAVTTEWT